MTRLEALIQQSWKVRIYMVHHDVGGFETKGKVHVQSKTNPPKSLKSLSEGASLVAQW